MSRTAVRTAPGALALGLALAVSGCADRAGDGAAPTSAPATGTTGAPSGPPGGDGGLVLEVAYTGGFVTPQMLAGRLPLVAVYDDGRLISEGPVAAIHPGPALPNVQVRQLDPDRVAELVEQARAAGIGASRDYGRPPIADAPSTRFTLVTDEGTETAEVYALSDALAPGGEPLPGLTEEQLAARGELQELLDELTGAAGGAEERYVPEAVAAVVGDWTDAGDGLPPPDEVTWPGPPLPGEALDERLGVSCVTARGEAADAVLDAAASATTTTPWTSEDGQRWSLMLRPLLPHESGCADLAQN